MRGRRVDYLVILDDFSGTQRRIGVGDFEAAESLHDRVDLLQARIELVLVVDERILARLAQRSQTVELLVDVLDLRAQQLGLDIGHLIVLLLLLLALELHSLTFVHDQFDLIVEQCRLGLFDLDELTQQLVTSFVEHSFGLVERLVHEVNHTLDRAVQVTDLVLHVAQRQIETVYALIRLEHVDLGHAFDGDRERHDDVVGVRCRLEMRLAYRTERLVARLTEQQLLVGVVETAGYDIARFFAFD